MDDKTPVICEEAQSMRDGSTSHDFFLVHVVGADAEMAHHGTTGRQRETKRDLRSTWAMKN